MSGAFSSPEKPTYNNRGWVTPVTDAKGKNWSTTFDAAGNVTRTTKPLSLSWDFEFERDQLGRARKVTDPRLNYTHTEEEKGTQIFSRRDLNAETWSYTTAGQLEVYTDREGRNQEPVR